MKKSTEFSPEVRQRAVRMVQEHRGEYPSLWAKEGPMYAALSEAVGVQPV